MESSWSYVSGGKGFMTSDTMSTSERKMPWWSGDSRAPSGFGNGFSASGFSPVDNQGLGPIGYQDFDGRQLHETSMGDFMSTRVHGGRIISPYTRLEEENSSRLSSSIVDSDLQLGVFGGPLFASSPESYMPPRRTRMGVNCNAPYCQVYGCNKDLSSSKDYHKRHKVCEAHSKTAKVIVNGIEQRFCQQCSRFHLLVEFDDGKRSCRKRLAGHNQRRRKPQVGFHSGRTGRLLHAYNAGPYTSFENDRFHGTALSPTSFVCPDLLPSDLIQHAEKYKPNDWSSRIKVEQVPMSYGNQPSRLLFPFSNGTGSIFAENSSFLDAAMTIQGVSGITDSGCALSLLSSQSTNSHYSMAHVSEKLMGLNSLTSSSDLPIPERNEAINFEIANGIYQGPHFVNEPGGTINLLQREFENESMQRYNSNLSGSDLEETCSFFSGCNYKARCITR